MSLDLWSPRRNRNALFSLTHSSGQAVVEFTLVFLLFLIIAWIPADFGLASIRVSWLRMLRVKGLESRQPIQSSEAERFAEIPGRPSVPCLLAQEIFLAKPLQGFRPRFFQEPQSPQR